MNLSKLIVSTSTLRLNLRPQREACSVRLYELSSENNENDEYKDKKRE